MKTIKIHLFCLLLFIGGCGVFWLLGGGENQSGSQNYLDNDRLTTQATEVGGVNTSHNASIKTNGGEADNSPFPPITSEDVSEPVSDKSATVKKETLAKKAGKIVANQKAQANRGGEDAAPSAKGTEDAKSGFHKMDKKSGFTDKGVGAVIHESPKSISVGSKVKLRLTDDIIIGGARIAQNTTFYAKVTLSAERVHLQTETITYKRKDYPLDATVYDTDGKEGIRLIGEKTSFPTGYKLMIKIK